MWSTGLRFALDVIRLTRQRRAGQRLARSLGTDLAQQAFRRLFTHEARRARPIPFSSTGSSNAARIAMIAIVHSNSTSVKARRIDEEYAQSFMGSRGE
jgi:hypothetical protein